MVFLITTKVVFAAGRKIDALGKYENTIARFIKDQLSNDEANYPKEDSIFLLHQYNLFAILKYQTNLLLLLNRIYFISLSWGNGYEQLNY